MPVEKRKPIIHVIPAKLHFKRLRVALYCRVSTQMERQLHSLSVQMDFEKEAIFLGEPRLGICRYLYRYQVWQNHQPATRVPEPPGRL